MAVVLIFCTCIVSGIGLTMHSDLQMRAEERFFSGWVIGIVAFTLMGLLSTRLFSFNGTAVAIAGVLTLAMSATGWKRGLHLWAEETHDLRQRLAKPLRSGENPVLLFALLVPFWIIIGRLFWYAYQYNPDGGISSGHLASWTDWQAHLTYTASFAFADNTALNLPTATGNNIGYHTGINYFAALLIPGGASLPGSLQLSGAFTLFAFPGVMYSVGMRVFQRQATALLGTFLFLFFGGWGWLEFRKDFDELGFDVFDSLPRTYTRLPGPNEGSFLLENPIVGHFFPQRPTMIGFPIVLLLLGWLYTAWTKSSDENRTMTRSFMFCGVLLGLTPFFNLFAFGAPLVFVLGWFALTKFNTRWLYTLVPALVLAAPVVIFLQPPSSTLEVPYDWVGHILYPGGIPSDRGTGTLIWDWIVFWARNIGIFVPLLAIAQAARGVLDTRIAWGLMPVWLFFIGPNLVKPHPWNGNNTHYFVLILLIGALPVAALIVHIVRRVPPTVLLAIPALLSMTASGMLDVYATNDRETSPYPALAMDGAAVAVGEWARTTDKDSVFVIETGWDPGDTSGHLHPVPALSGRDVVVGFDGWVYDLGIPDWSLRKEHSRQIFDAAPGYEALLKTYEVDYLVMGPTERTPSWDPNIAFWEEEADVVYRHAGWTVFKI